MNFIKNLFRSDIGLLLLLNLLLVWPAYAAPKLPVLLAQASNSKVMFILDDSNSMESVIEHPDYNSEDAAVLDSTKRIPSFIFRLNSGVHSPDGSDNSQTLTPLLITNQIGYTNQGLSSYGHVYSGNLFNSTYAIPNVSNMPLVKSWLPTSTCCFVCLTGFACDWPSLIGINNAVLFGNSSIKGSAVFSTANLAKDAGVNVTDANGNEFFYVDMQKNDYVLNFDWGTYWPRLGANDAPLPNHYRMYTTTGGTVVFNGHTVFLSAGLYEERYLRWIFYVADDAQRAALPGITRSQLVKDVMEMLILSNPQVKFGLATLNGTSFNAGVHTGTFDNQFYTPEGDTTFLTKRTVRAPIGTAAATLISELDIIGAASGTPLQRTYVETMRYFDADTSNYNPTNINYKTVYGSPVTGVCDTHFIVLLTDGLPTRDCQNKFRNKVIPNADNDPDTFGSDSSCSDGKEYSQLLDDAAKVANITDFSSTLAGLQNITSYAVGLGLNYNLLNKFAINGGSGQSLRANNAQELTDTLTEIVSTILQTPVAGAGFALAEAVGLETRIFRPTFYQQTWRGTIDVFKVEDSNTVFQFDMGELLEQRNLSSSPRHIWAGNDPDGDGKTTTMIDFSTGNAATLRPQLFKRYVRPTAPEPTTNLAVPLRAVTQTGAAQSLIQFIQGIDQPGLRVRDFDTDGKVEKLGDIIYSRPVEIGARNGKFERLDGYDGFVRGLSSQPNLLVVGANDGMLHAFNATTGEELWAYIPSNLLSELEYLARPDYNVNWHRYFVDGPITVQDAWVAGQWRTVLIFGQREGGTTYTALDITDRSHPALLWEVSNPELYGETWTQASVIKAGGSLSSYLPNDFKWYMAVGTGENKTTAGNNVVLYELTAAQPSPIALPIEAAATAGVRTSGVTWTDNDKDLNDDRGYVGTENGDLYRIEVGTGNPNSWPVKRAFDGSATQPITATPTVVLAENPQFIINGTGEKSLRYADAINFGTGRFDASADIAWYQANPQKIFGIFDPVKTVSDDYQYALNSATTSDLQAQEGTGYNIVRSNNKLFLPNTKKGFSIAMLGSISLDNNFINPVGEVLHPASAVRGAIVYSTFLPNPNSCEIGGHSFLEVVDFRTGGGIMVEGLKDTPIRAFYSGGTRDYNKDNVYNLSDVIKGISEGYAEIVIDAKIDAIDLSDSLHPYKTDGALTEGDIRLHATNGGIRPTVSSLGNAGAPSQPAISITDEAVFFQNAYVGLDPSEAEADVPTVICHIPPGNPNNKHTIRVGAASVPAHLAHGDVLGACPNDPAPDSPPGNTPGDGHEDVPDLGMRDIEPPGRKEFNIYQITPRIISFHEYSE